jgi:hypothetical protein
MDLAFCLIVEISIVKEVLMRLDVDVDSFAYTI